MKAIFYNIFGLGHINPTLPIVRSLVKKGVEVIYHSSPERRDLIESSGAQFCNYGYDSYKAQDFNPGKNFVLQTLPATVGLLPFLQKEILFTRPDLILYDSMAPWGHCLSKIHNIPSICSVSTFALSQKKRQEMMKSHQIEVDETNIKALDILSREFGVSLNLDHALGSYSNHNMVYTTKSFNPELDDLDPSHFHFLGNIQKEEFSQEEFPFHLLEKTKRKVITVSFGSLIPLEDESVIERFKMMSEAVCENLDILLILAVGSEENLRKLGPLPSNTLAFARIPQERVLQYTDLFITHGGMNSLNEALSLGVPMIVIPHNYDQFMNAQRISQLGLGQVLKKDSVNLHWLAPAIARGLAEIRRPVLKAQGGLNRALEIIHEVTS